MHKPSKNFNFNRRQQVRRSASKREFQHTAVNAHFQPSNIFVTGKLIVNAQNCGFIDQADDGETIRNVFIPPSMLAGAMTGDIVKAELDRNCDMARPSGRVIEILQQTINQITGCLAVSDFDGTWGIRPLRRDLPAFIKLHFDGKTKLTEGDWLQVKLLRPNQPEQQIRCELIKKISHSGTVTADLDAIVTEYTLPKQYTAKANTSAAKLVPAKVKREDCKSLTTVTIDPVDARDYDDALSCELGPEKHQITVGVHIADVASYVKRGTALDAEAASRGFTSYLPGRTIPMLPTKISNDICSLKAGEERLAHSIFITFDRKSGRIISYRRAHTIIISNARLCYDEVQRFLDGEKIEFPPKVGPLLKHLADIAKKIRGFRQAHEQFLPMEMPEIRVICSEKPPRITGIHINESSPSHQLVEEFMLAANQCVADELIRKNIPGLFRNHDEPDYEAMAEFAAIASQILGRPVKPIKSRAGIVKFINQIQDSPARDVVEMIFLRHLKRASYDIENRGHFGLGKEMYCHFTSPIRRYTDLVVHQQLLAIDQKRKPKTLEELSNIAQNCTDLEYNCDQAEFAASDRMKLRWLEQEYHGKSAPSIRGTITKITKHHCQVWLPDFGIMANIGEKQLPFENWKFRESDNCWIHKKTKRCLSLRTSAVFRIVSTDPVRNELVVKPII